jgi:hypothetical protein
VPLTPSGEKGLGPDAGGLATVRRGGRQLGCWLD